MNIPNWWEFALLAGAAWRLFWLLAEDDLLARPRDRVRGKYRDWLTCPYCFGFWVTLAWWGAWQFWPHGALVVAAPFALSAAMIGIYKLLASD